MSIDQVAYQEGQEAFRAGKAKNPNPYNTYSSRGPELYDSWKAGWEDVQRESQS